MSRRGFIEVDDRAFAEALAEYRDAMRKDLGSLVKQQARLFLRDVVGYMKAENRKVGRMRVERDILRVFRSKQGNARLAAIEMTNNPEQFDKFASGYKNQAIADRLRTLSRAGKVSALQKLLANVAPSTARGLDREAKTPDPAMHASLKYKGFVRKGVRGYAYTGKFSDLRKYIRAEQAKVGSAKAGWLAAASKVGLSLPAYVRAATRAQGRVEVNANPDNPSITAINADPSAVAQDAQYDMLRRAYANRVKSMEDVTRRILERNAKKASSK